MLVKNVLRVTFGFFFLGTEYLLLDQNHVLHIKRMRSLENQGTPINEVFEHLCQARGKTPSRV